jgi:hypothetical protein
MVDKSSNLLLDGQNKDNIYDNFNNKCYITKNITY